MPIHPLKIWLNGVDISEQVISAYPVVIRRRCIPAGEPLHLAMQAAGQPGLVIERTPQAEIDATVSRMLDYVTTIDPDGGRP